MSGTEAGGAAAIDATDVVVLGGGHAGIEAASAAARMGCSVALVTMDRAAIGRMSCNPAIGGTAKAHLVHEIDALGGVMGELADRTGIQFRILNRSKGPAVWSTRCQSDRDSYARCAREHVESLAGIRIVAGTIVAADRGGAGGGVSAVTLDDGRRIPCRALVIASGTFLDAVMYTGLEPTAGGRAGEPAAVGLGGWLARAGLATHRLKTGTPPRLYRDSIDLSVCEEQAGDADPQPFSGRTCRAAFPVMPQVSCYVTHTTAATHAALRTGFGRSPIFTGAIAGRGPRYCPSIEDKLVRFADRDRHQLFIEPDGLRSDLIYLNGFSTSLPREVQAAALATIPGLERARMARPGYAVEYESVPAYQLGPTLQTRAVPGLFLAGQVCGTSGYEEAAALGLMAGINAACRVQGRPPFTLGRSEAYIGVMIDDLTTREWREPYRMFTSRAEHRLVLRQDNAERRLAHYGHRLGLVGDAHYRRVAAPRGGGRGRSARPRNRPRRPARGGGAAVRRRHRADRLAGAARRPGPPPAGAVPRPAGGRPARPAYPRSARSSPTPRSAPRWLARCATPATSGASGSSSSGRPGRRRCGFPSRSTTQRCGRCRRRRPRRLARIRPSSIGQASRVAGVTPGRSQRAAGRAPPLTRRSCPATSCSTAAI